MGSNGSSLVRVEALRGATTSRGKGGRGSPFHTLATERGYPTLREMSAADIPPRRTDGCTEDREISSRPASSPHASATLCYGAGLECAERVEQTLAWRTVAAPPSEPKRALFEETQTCSLRCQGRELLDRSQERALLTLRPEFALQTNKPSFLSGKESDEMESGIGVIFRRIYGDHGASVWKVIAISKGGAAAKEGTIRLGMHLKQIGDVDVRGMEAHRIAPLILGAKNSKVTLKMIGPILGDSEDPGHYVTVVLTRDHATDMSGNKRFMCRGASKSGNNLRT